MIGSNLIMSPYLWQGGGVRHMIDNSSREIWSRRDVSQKPKRGDEKSC